MSKIIYQTIMLLIALGFSNNALAIKPILHFSDLISGPDTGLGDGNGSGVIVTVWGQYLGSSQGISTIEYCDSTSTCRSGHVYYWKNADGSLPGGPANLYESHRMQEIAFSIPDSAAGAGNIKVTVSGDESTLPFTVRSGAIYHVRDSGGDFSSVGDAEANIKAPGATVYVHDSQIQGDGNGDALYVNNRSAVSSLAAQYTFVAAPNSQPKLVAANNGFSSYNDNLAYAGLSIAKYIVEASNYTGQDANGQPTGFVGDGGATRGIQTQQDGRIIGNRVTDQNNGAGCASKFQGAINGGNGTYSGSLHNAIIFGNEIHDYGCQGSSKLHHTTYFSIREASPDANAPEIGYNYLHDNWAKNGIHVYDQDTQGVPHADLLGELKIHNNVVFNQGGAGIQIGTVGSVGWSADHNIFNNILINTGLPADWNGVDPNTVDGPVTSAIAIVGTGLTGSVDIYNNTIITWNDYELVRAGMSGISVTGGSQAANVSNNLFVTDKDLPFSQDGFQGTVDNLLGSNNIFYTTVSSPTLAVVPSWASNSITTNPEITVSGVRVSVGATSSAIAAGVNPPYPLSLDIYGIERLPGAEIGVVEFLLRPEPPSNTNIN